MGAYPDATHGAVIFTYIIHHYPTLTPILLPSFVGFYLPAPWVAFGILVIPSVQRFRRRCTPT